MIVVEKMKWDQSWEEITITEFLRDMVQFVDSGHSGELERMNKQIETLQKFTIYCQINSLDISDIVDLKKLIYAVNPDFQFTESTYKINAEKFGY